MAYVNEKISEEDYKKYNLAEINLGQRYGNQVVADFYADTVRYWVIDRERCGLKSIMDYLIEIILELKYGLNGISTEKVVWYF